MSTSKPVAPLYRFAHYEVTAKIGEGGMGEVWRATDTTLGREVALKVLPEDFASDPDRRARFEREAKALAALNHPNIATVFGLDQVDGRYVLVMELLEGESLRERLADGPLPYRKAAEIGAAIARGVGAAHDRGIVHRDIKPENVYLTNDGQVRVLDFGLATDRGYGIGVGGNTETPTVTRRTDPGTVLGTVGYMAPEQVRGDRIDPRADIFALGTVLFDEQNVGGDEGYLIYVRDTSGSPPIRIGGGTGRALSPDGKWALSVLDPFGEPRLALLPTGPGEARELPEGKVQNILWAHWLPDGHQLVLAGSEPGTPIGLFLRDLDPADENLLTRGGIDYLRSGYAVSPDGLWVTATPIDGPPALVPIDGGDPRPIPGLEDGEVPVQWTADGRELYVYRSGELPARVSLVDVTDGSRRPWHDLEPNDTAGVFGIDYLAVNPGGDGYVYSYRRLLSTLYVIEGLR